jgi:hypothetical protein
MFNSRWGIKKLEKPELFSLSREGRKKNLRQAAPQRIRVSVSVSACAILNILLELLIR